MSRKRKVKEPGAQTGINLMPVLSIVFLILLFFVASVPFARERGIDLLSKWGGAICECGPCGKSSVVISVDSRNRIFVEDNGKPGQIDVRSVRTIVARGLAESPQCGVLVQAHRQSDMGTVVRVMDEAKKARDRPPPAVSLKVVD